MGEVQSPLEPRKSKESPSKGLVRKGHKDKRDRGSPGSESKGGMGSQEESDGRKSRAPSEGVEPSIERTHRLTHKRETILIWPEFISSWSSVI